MDNHSFPLFKRTSLFNYLIR